MSAQPGKCQKTDESVLSSVSTCCEIVIQRCVSVFPLLPYRHLFPELAFSQAVPVVQTDRPTDRQMRGDSACIKY